MALVAPAAALLASSLDALALDADADARRDPVAALPQALLLRVFYCLPLKQRLRCEEVCRGWRTVLEDVTAWTVLDLRRSRGGRRADALLHAAAARARGRLRVLRVGGLVPHEALCDVAAANAASLHQLQLLDAVLSCEQLDSLLRAAPQLRLLETGLHCGDSEEELATARARVRGEGLPPNCSLRLPSLFVDSCARHQHAGLAADITAHGVTRKFGVSASELDTPAAMDVFVDAALACRMTHVEFSECVLPPACVPAIARLLGGNVVKELIVADYEQTRLLDAGAAALLRDALSANTSLTALTLMGGMLWQDATAAGLLFGALTAHPRLRVLDVSGNDARATRRAAGAALAALLYADAPALRELRCNECALGDAGMAPICAALAHNTHLRVFTCCRNNISAACARDVLLPAVRANASLRTLIAVNDAAAPQAASIEEAMAHVAARGAAE
jgi:hypothetical protein